MRALRDDGGVIVVFANLTAKSRVEETDNRKPSGIPVGRIGDPECEFVVL